jgi:S-adenosylmethionine:tRNA ribosyltransferase-isomerase
MEDAPQDHKMHTEWCQVSANSTRVINETRQQGGRIVAVGTTSVRSLESAALAARQAVQERAADQPSGVGSLQGELPVVAPYEGATDLFILPGYSFRAVDAMITNFHLPRSTLLMLVSAFAGRERILAAYQEAKEHGYRFYSFGDAMLIL